MSARKRKAAAILPVFQDIQDLLLVIKPRLGEAKRSAWSLLVPDLDKVAAQAEAISQQRPKSNKDWQDVADALDREGVYLWNAATTIKGAESDVGPEVVAALRMAGFRLIEAGLEQHQPFEGLVHVLRLASKAGASLSEVGRHGVATSILACAAKYEEQLRTIDDAESSHQQTRAQAVVLYHSSRMEAAWREGNAGVADFFLDKVTEHDQRVRLLPPHDRVALAAKLLEIGRSILKTVREGHGDAVQLPPGEGAVKWMQKAFSIIELSDDASTAGMGDLKRSILRSLARAYYMSSSHDADNLDRAETTLNELIDTLDSAADRGNPEHQQLRWMRIAVLKRRKAAESQLLDAFKSIIDHMSYSDSNVTDILQELRTLAQYHTLVTAVHQHALQKAVDSEAEGCPPCVDRLLLSLLFHCSKDEDHSRAMRDVEAALACIHGAEIVLPKVPATACLTLLWQFGDRHYNAKRWPAAADWFLCGAHPVFASMARPSNAKCFRKAALCHIQQREYSRASAILRRCPNNDAATRYVALLAAVHQGSEAEAIEAVRGMAEAPDFDRKMLLLATQLANESDMKTLLLAVLQALLDTVQAQDGRDVHLETLTLIRCIIRLTVKLMAEPGVNSNGFVPTLIGHFITGKTLIESLPKAQRAVAAKDISWLWRTAYNCAVQGCADWEAAEDAVTKLFDTARELLEIYCTSSVTDVDPDLHVYVANASFAAVAGKVFALRRRLDEADDGPQDLNGAFRNISLCKDRIQGLLENKHLIADEDVMRARSFIHILRLFQAEVCCLMKNWGSLLGVIQDAVRSDALATETFEAFADMLWVEKDCPVEVLFAALEAILHASLDRASLSVEKFSRWLRAICTILLSRNSSADRAKALRYVEQAVAVLEEHTDDLHDENVYPMDERQWLLGTSYNTGIECLHVSLADEARRWFEASTVVCRFVPDGGSRAAKISETYTTLLERFQPGASTSTNSDLS
ncbi:SPO22 domain-containing protein [Phanerochaete sordida]|uniref:Protein ZIP4 homolog n=1 Tax=Phanerochaete sordida TaxID=48140 RepID=A0A9P3GN62_9APHY|nr:SPO22 domain-containing protein [Phanerochaete sordida]